MMMNIENNKKSMGHPLGDTDKLTSGIDSSEPQVLQLLVVGLVEKVRGQDLENILVVSSVVGLLCL